jgi:hypothetical protein
MKMIALAALMLCSCASIPPHSMDVLLTGCRDMYSPDLVEESYAFPDGMHEVCGYEVILRDDRCRITTASKIRYDRDRTAHQLITVACPAKRPVVHGNNEGMLSKPPRGPK